MNTLSLWLIFPLFLSLYSLWSYSRFKMSWAWAFALQALVITLTSIVGLATGSHWLWVALAWLEISLFWFVPRTIVSRINESMNILNAAAVEKMSRYIGIFYWGQSAQFWKEAVRAIACFIRGESEKGHAILEHWYPLVPVTMQSQIEAYRLTGDLISWNWPAVMARYEKVHEQKKKQISATLYIAASRAYAETGDFTKSASCLEEAKLDQSRSPTRSVALMLLPFFALVGDLAHLEELLSLISSENKSLPDYARMYWLGRCLISSGENEEGRRVLEKALETAKSNTSYIDAWQQRINTVISRIPAEETKQAQSEAPVSSEKAAAREKVWGLFERVAFVQEVISPNQHSFVVAGLCLMIIVVYLFTGFYVLLPNETSIRLSTELITYGCLDPPRVLAGEYYRLLTSLFLHKDLMHCMVNVIGLYWFGRVAQNIFGTTRFIFIYLTSGVLSGIAHTLLSFNQLQIGASGAIMGIFGAVAAGILRMRSDLPEKIWRSELIWLGCFAIFSAVSDQMIPGVAVMAHLGGLVAGVIFGLIVRVPKPKYKENLAVSL